MLISSPPVKVEVAVVVARNEVATICPATEKAEYGEDVPTPTFPVDASTIRRSELTVNFPAPPIVTARFELSAGSMFKAPEPLMVLLVRYIEPAPV